MTSPLRLAMVAFVGLLVAWPLALSDRMLHRDSRSVAYSVGRAAGAEHLDTGRCRHQPRHWLCSFEAPGSTLPMSYYVEPRGGHCWQATLIAGPPENGPPSRVDGCVSVRDALHVSFLGS
jgi:hypothetical protein